MNYGMEIMPDSAPRKLKIFEGENVKIYNYFKEHFFGMERVISKMTSVFLKSTLFSF